MGTAAIIPLIQIGIYAIIGIMVFLVLIFIFIVSKSQGGVNNKNSNNYNSATYEKRNGSMKDFSSREENDDDPIQNL